MRRLLWASVVCVGCSGGGFQSNGADLGADLAQLFIPDLAVRPNVPPPEPPMVSKGGPVLHAMQLWTVVWAGDEALGAQIDAFHARVFASPYWAQAVGEYGVGPGTARGVFVIGGARPQTITHNEESAIVEGLLARGDLPTTDQTVVDFVVGADVQTFEGQSLQQACSSFSGYHFETSDPPHHPFLVELPCQDPSKTLSVFDNLTWTESHEMAEAATDPLPNSQPGWQLSFPLALEVGDLCLVPATLDVNGGSDGGGATYTVSRVYSAKAAAQGGIDPCVPAPPGPYFNMGLQPSDPVITTIDGLHGSTTVNLVAFSNGPSMPMKWSAFTFGKITPDHGTNLPGDIVPLTITAPGFAGQAGSNYLVVEISDPGARIGVSQAWVGVLTIR